jgi:hypothetical protein
MSGTATEETTWVRRVFLNLLKARALGKKVAALPGESARDHRIRIENAVAERWGCAASTLRAFKSGRRRPTLKSHPRFFEDLEKFGNAEFDKRGRVKRETLNTGPTIQHFFATTAPGRDAQR